MPCQTEQRLARSRRCIVPTLLTLCAWSAPVLAGSPVIPASSVASGAVLAAVPGPPPIDGVEGVAREQTPELPGETAKEEKVVGDEEAEAKREFSLQARVMAGFEHERERPRGGQVDPAQSEYGFLAKQVRLGVRAELSERFRINVSFDLSDALSPETGTSYSSPEYIRTATLDYRPSNAFRFTVGRFKRPFSRLELESVSDLPVLNRGLLNDLGIEDNQWGDRALGVQASGRVKRAKLRWYLSLTNPAWSSSLQTEGLDVLGRVQVGLTKQLTLGVNGGHKYLKLGERSLHDWGFGGDLTLELGPMRLLVEGSYVALPFVTDRPNAFGALALLDYQIPLNADWALDPTLFVELADANAELSQTESARVVVGINAVGHDGFRIMPQLALVRSIGDTSRLNPWPEGETFSLIFSLVL